jgi:hypothetical protein
MLLDDGELATLAPVSFGIDAAVPFETATRVALTDLAMLYDLAVPVGHLRAAGRPHGVSERVTAR